MLRCALATFVLAFAACAPAAPLTLYLSPAGSDAWSGALAKPNAAKTDGPVASPAGALAAARKLRATEAVTVQVQAGTYRLTAPLVLQPADSGVSFVGTGPTRPIFSGGRLITGWKQEPGGLWSAPAPGLDDLRALYVNGERATLARSPNTGYFRTAGKAAPLNENGQEVDSAKRAFRFKPGDLQNWPDATGGDVFVCFHWETGLLRIKSVDDATSTVAFTGEFKWPFWSNQRYFIEGVRAALDAPGEFYRDRTAGRLYYLPRPGQNMAKAEVVAPVLTQLVLLQGDAEAGLPVERVRFDNLSFQHTNYVLEPEGHSDWQAAVTVNAAIQANGARQCALTNCEIARLGNYAVWFQRACQGNSVTACYIHNCSAGGVRLGEGGPPSPANETGSNTVANNLIRDLGIDFYGAIGVWIGHASDSVVAHNEICDLNYSGISCGWSWGFAPTKHKRNTIEYNYIHHAGRGRMCDMAAIYTLGLSEGTVVRNNLIHDIWDWEEGYGAGGIYPDEGSSGIVIENNVVYRTASGGLTVHYGRDDIARNNIFAYGRDSQIHLGRRDMKSSLTLERNIVYYDEGALFQRESDLVADENLYWNTAGDDLVFPGSLDFPAWQATGHDVHSLIADPRFVDPAHYNFALRPDSPALKLGFKPIDVSTCGITGPPALVKLARSIKREVSAMPRRSEAPPLSLDEGFENTPLGSTADITYTHGEANGATIRVTNEQAAAGKRSLKFTDAPGLDQPWNPHIFYSPNLTDGLAACSFDLRVEPGAKVWHEWRDAASPYRVGPSLGVNEAGEVIVKDKPVVTLPHSQWIHFEITAQLGKRADGTWNLAITLPNQPPQRLEKLPCDPKWRQLLWMGFISNATETTAFYLDNLKLHVTK